MWDTKQKNKKWLVLFWHIVKYQEIVIPSPPFLLSHGTDLHNLTYNRNWRELCRFISIQNSRRTIFLSLDDSF